MIFGAASLPAMAHDSTYENTILVQGRGQIKTNPDSLEVTATIETQSKNAKMARLQNAEKATAVINAIKALNVAGLKVSTGWFNSSPQYKYDNGKNTIVGYQVNNNLNIKIEASSADLQTVASDVVDAAITNGATNVSNIRFYISDNNPVFDEALKLAVKQAKRRAELMASAAGVRVSGVYTMESYSQSSPEVSGAAPRMMVAKMSMDSAYAEPSTPILNEPMNVEASVTVRFDLQDTPPQH